MTEQQQVFTRFEVFNRMRGGTLLAWELNPFFSNQLAGPVTFTVQQSRTTAGDVINVGTAQDTYVFEDTRQWVYGKDLRAHYRVVFTQGNVQYESKWQQPLSNLDTHDTMILRELIRKEELRMVTQIGICGYLFKRRVWGVKCPTCLDFDTGEVRDGSCDICKGTGYVGGYFDGITYYVTESQGGGGRRKVILDAVGKSNNQRWAARGLNCPWLDSGDVWVDFDSDQRYVIQTINDINYRGQTIIFDPVELRLVPVSDVIYTLTRPDESSSSSSSSGSA
jgi:hypothetical protein